MKEYYLSIVMRYGEGTHVLFSMENDMMVKEEVYHFVQNPVKKNGILTWDTDVIFQEILHGMKKCKEIGKIPVSVGITGWGCDYVLLDKKNEMIGGAFHGMDQRSWWLGDEIGKFLPESDLYSMTGLWKRPFISLYQLMADKLEIPERIERAEHFLLLTDYFHFLLCGIMKNEYTGAATSMLINPNTKDWNHELIEILGLPHRIFGEIVRPGEQLSELLPEIADIIGYNCKVILPCTYDMASMCAALPSNEKNAIFIRSDEYASIGREIQEADCSERSRKYSFTNDAAYQGYLYYEIIMGVGMMQRIRSELAPELSLAEIGDMAQQAKITSVVDILDPRYHYAESIAKAVADACGEMGQTIPKTVGEYASVLFRSLAKAFAEAVENTEKLTEQKGACIHVIGTIYDVHYLNQLLAEETGLPVTAGPIDARAVGNAIIQMISSGVFRNLKEARECIGRSFEIHRYYPHARESISDAQVVQSWNTAEIVIRCAKLLSGTKDFDFAINQVLLEISKVVRPDRLMIIGTDHITVNVLYEWTAIDVPPRKTYLQNIPYEAIEVWEKYVREDGVVIQRKGESSLGIKRFNDDIIPKSFIPNMMAVPLFNNEKLIGYLGVENFLDEEIINIRELLETISFFIASEMIVHRLMMELKVLGSTDMLTGVNNRNAMNGKISELAGKTVPVGVLYADVNGLKRVNDEQGHIAGDALIKRAGEILMKVFASSCIFRAGGDEFVIIEDNVDQNLFLREVQKLEDILAKEKGIAIAVGYHWSETAVDLNDTVRKADEAMYENKQKFYKEHNLKPR